MSDEYILNSNKCYKKKSFPLFDAWVQVTVPEGDNTPIWKGAPIPFEMWTELVAWCQLTQEKFKSEAMAILFYDDEKHEWSCWYPPQKTSGMAVQTSHESKQYIEERAKFPDMQAGTLHHHCTTSAFQSGTDRADEIDRDGIHITIGKLGSDELDIHVRVCLLGESHTIDIATVVQAPEYLKDVPAKYALTLLDQILKEPLNEEQLDGFKKRLEPEMAKVSRSSHGAQSGSKSWKSWESWESNNTPSWKSNNTPSWKSNGSGHQSQLGSALDDMERDWWKYSDEVPKKNRKKKSEMSIPNAVFKKHASFFEEPFQGFIHKDKKEGLLGLLMEAKHCLPDEWEDEEETLEMGKTNPMDELFISAFEGYQEILLDDIEQNSPINRKIDLITKRARACYLFHKLCDLKEEIMMEEKGIFEELYENERNEIQGMDGQEP